MSDHSIVDYGYRRITRKSPDLKAANKARLEKMLDQRWKDQHGVIRTVRETLESGIFASKYIYSVIWPEDKTGHPDFHVEEKRKVEYRLKLAGGTSLTVQKMVYDYADLPEDRPFVEYK